MIPLEEHPVEDVVCALGSFTLCTDDPPWSALAPRLPAPARLILARNVDLPHLESLIAHEPASAAVVGLGGGSALDTAKFIAWKTGKRLVQVPSITSVDAAFTDAIGVRMGRNVRYIGKVLPERVVLDVELVRSAPPRLNRAGIGDVLSCHTALHDWRLAAARGTGPAWDDAAAQLGETLLRELDERAEAVRAVTPEAVRWLASAYRRIGAACSSLGHSRFEEGSEHFFAYAYEHRTGARPLHGELVAMAVLAMSSLQRNSYQFARGIVRRTGICAHPRDLGVEPSDFVATLLSLREHAAQERWDHSIVNETRIDAAAAQRLWTACTI